ncbi:hemerythrin domain-containing protein [Blastococcus sp. TF02A-35]|uniref:hemerythrin domain-containing protein n=1 Tax=Blastococcus sp. TF02A-35 TaxID=2559612 RepID=UPI00107343CC|nr:hemerythrin domain-containing protein [Blastococcus sp. TF02A_35]TFV51715.1 hemerythrin domain-containing protein [Blastococcus sp. TF02A_35]
MAAPMTMNRVIHAAVRRDLQRLETALDDWREGDRARGGELDRAFANLRAELTHHHETEDTHIWPMLAAKGVDPELLAAMEDEHEAMAEALARTATALGALAATGSTADAAAASASVGRTREIVERHLRHEEDDLEPQLAPHHGSPEWKAVERKLRSRPLGDTGRFFAWLTDGAAEPERQFLRSTVPAPVLTVFTRVLGRRYTREVAPLWRAQTSRH